MKEKPTWLTKDIFQIVFEGRYGKNFKIKSFTIEDVENPWDNTQAYGVNVEIKFNGRKSASIFGCGNKKMEESLSYLLRMSSESEFQIYDKVIPAFEKLYSKKGKNLLFAQEVQKVFENKVLLFENPKSKCLRKLIEFSEKDLKSALQKLAEFHAASAVYAENCDQMENFSIHVENSKEIQDLFVDKVKPMIIEKCDNGEYFALQFFGEYINDYYDPKEFNVLNHGQFWANSVLFGASDEIFLTDFKSPKFGSPALDLYYFLLSAISMNDNTKKFDFYIKNYYDCLVENLKLLGFKKEIPLLTDIRISLIRHGVWAKIALCEVVNISLRSTKEFPYDNERCVKVLQDLIPWMDNRGLLEHKNSPISGTPLDLEDKIAVEIVNEVVLAQDSDIHILNNNDDQRIPNWIGPVFFEDIIKKEMGGFSKITEFRPEVIISEENYLPLLLRIHIKAELTGVGNYRIVKKNYVIHSSLFLISDNSKKKFSYLLKTYRSHANSLRETEIYKNILPMLENMYMNRRAIVKFGPKTYNLASNPGVDHLVLEDFKEHNFKSADKLDGLDTLHIKSALNLMAKYHAASAVAFETIKPYSERLTVGFYDKRNRELFSELIRRKRTCLNEIIIGSHDNGEYYAKKLIRNIYDHTDEIFNFFRAKPDEFNVLNHGNCGSNSFLFKYNDNDELSETLFLDFQSSMYGSPVVDLYYFLLACPEVDIKLKKFDDFIEYYHTNLVNFLQMLGYPKQIPSLTDLHDMLAKNSVVARNAVIGVMGAVLLDHTENANIDDAGTKSTKMMFENRRYKRALSKLLPWMDKKGLLV